MASPTTRLITLTATGVVDAGPGDFYSAGLCAGADAATAVLRTGGAGGTVLLKLAASAGTSVQRTLAGGVRYADLHATLTGTAPTLDVEA